MAVERGDRTRSLFSAIVTPLEHPFLAFEMFQTSFPCVWFSCRHIPYRPMESDRSLFYFPAGAFSCSFISNEADQFLPGLVATFRCNSLSSRGCNFSRNAIVIAVLHTRSPCMHCISFLSFLLLFRRKFTISSLLHDIFLTYAMLFSLPQTQHFLILKYGQLSILHN